MYLCYVLHNSLFKMSYWNFNWTLKRNLLKESCKEAFKKKESVDFFHSGGGYGPNPYFYKNVENRVCFGAFARF